MAIETLETVRRRALEALTLLAISVVIGVLAIIGALPHWLWPLQWLVLLTALGMVARNQVRLVRERRRQAADR